MQANGWKCKQPDTGSEQCLLRGKVQQGTATILCVCLLQQRPPHNHLHTACRLTRLSHNPLGCAALHSHSNDGKRGRCLLPELSDRCWGPDSHVLVACAPFNMCWWHAPPSTCAGGMPPLQHVLVACPPFNMCWWRASSLTGAGGLTLACWWPAPLWIDLVAWPLGQCTLAAV